MEKEPVTGGLLSAVPAILLCVSIALAALFSGGNVTAFFGPSQTELAQKKEELRANRTALLLRLSICQRNTTKANDAYICPSSAVIYKSLGSSLDCKLAAEVAQELGLGDRNFFITQNAPASSITIKPSEADK